MALKYKQASLYTVLMVPHVCCNQSIKFLILSAVSAFAAKVLQNKSLKSQSFSKKNQSLILTTVIYSHKYTGQLGLGWAILLPMAGLGRAGPGWSRLGLDGSSYRQLVSRSLPRTGGPTWACLSHGYCRGAKQQVDTQCLLITKLRTSSTSIGQSKSQGQTQG